MGLFDFAKNFGRKLFTNDEEAADKIKAHIEANNPGVSNLGVEYLGGFVTLSGNSETAESVQKAILMAGNVEGVGKVVSNIEVADAAISNEADLEQTAAVEYYVIQSGDTLSKIAKTYYGNAMKYPRIFEANREVIEDPDKIFVGQKIRIPRD
jgi:nucleoid-associated protein YgaU